MNFDCVFFFFGQHAMILSETQAGWKMAELVCYCDFQLQGLIILVLLFILLFFFFSDVKILHQITPFYAKLW